jgi:hypothetical protein
VYQGEKKYQTLAIASVGPRLPAIAATIGSLFHQGGKIWANGYGSGVFEDCCPGRV